MRVVGKAIVLRGYSPATNPNMAIGSQTACDPAIDPRKSATESVIDDLLFGVAQAEASQRRRTGALRR